MLGNSELGLKKGGEENPLAKYFKEILNAARRGMQVSERLLAYRRLSTFGESLCELAPVQLTTATVEMTKDHKACFSLDGPMVLIELPGVLSWRLYYATTHNSHFKKPLNQQI